MDTTEITKRNAFIAEYMGCRKTQYPSAMRSPFHGRSVWFSTPSSDGKTRTFHCVVGEEVYHESWDWLMPVVGKLSNECEDPEELDTLKYALLCNDINTAWNFVTDYLIDKNHET